MQKVTLIPRVQARGLTWFIPGEDPTLISRQQIFARIVGALGGRAAEEVVFGLKKNRKHIKIYYNLKARFTMYVFMGDFSTNFCHKK
jgi:ATP-dependent Zn protease